MSCAAPDQSLPSQAAAGATVIEGTVRSASGPSAGAYVRLHDASGEFTAEVVASPEGAFRFYAAPGTWEVRVLAPGASTRGEIVATVGLNQTHLVLA